MHDKHTILIVDDNLQNVDLLADLFDNEGYNSIVATNGDDAIHAAKVRVPDLIILDIMMPGIDGFEISDKLKQDSNTREIPIIFLTAKADEDSVLSGFKHGAVDYITKPFIGVELLSRVKTHIEISDVKKESLRQQKLILKKHDQLMESITMASLIQNAALPAEEFVNQFLPQYFVLSLPKNVVSGDFYWIKQLENKIYIAVADCTGHGVPGAFMSMLSIAYLNELVDYERILAPNSILDEMRKKIKRAMHQDRRRDTISDGLDIALVVLDLNNKEMEFSGANRPAFILRNIPDKPLPEVYRLVPDKMPIAVHAKEIPFRKEWFPLEENDEIFLFSDGFIDQFGGEYGEKYKVKRFKKLLQTIYGKPTSEQKSLMLKAFYDWQGNQNQIDDVMVLGLKVQETYGDLELF